MQSPIGAEVSIHDLVPGEQYYAFHVREPDKWRFRATFIKYWIMPETDYKMTLFLGGIYDFDGDMRVIGARNCYPHGLGLRVFEPPLCRSGIQSYRYYKVARFDRRAAKELYERFILHKRRQIERGLTGTRPSGLWLPRDIVREISLCYLSQKTVARQRNTRLI
jgi:hypothetical protein